MPCWGSAQWQRRPWRTAGSRRAGCGRACSSSRSTSLPAELDGLRIAHLSDFHFGPPLPRAHRRAAGGGVGARAAPRPRRRHGRPALAPARQGRPRRRAAGARRLRRARQPRRRRHSGSVLARRGAGGAAGDDARRRLQARPASRSPGSDRGDRAVPERGGARTRRRRRASASCSATTRGCGRPATSSCSPATCTPGRSCCPTRAARSASPTCARSSTRGSTGADGVTLHVSPGLGTTFVPFRFFARPEATELVLRSER